MADPRVIDYVKRASQATGADPVALLADSLVESGAQLGAKGDQGTSFGPWQFHIGGALGSHTPAWASTYAAALNRAQEFSRLKVHGGKGAAAVQRPADPMGYAAKVDAALARARTLLGQQAGLPAAPTAAPAAPGAPGGVSGRSLQATLSAILNAGDPAAAFAQFKIGTQTTPMTVPTAASTSPMTFGPSGKVVAVNTLPKIIGTPYHGTHARAFNVSGGSNNWESENAIDIALPQGTPVYAPAGGVIGSQIGSLGSGGRFAGLRVHLQMPGNELYYAHLSRLAVRAGERVKPGQLIGYSGVANGVAHLHLGSKNGNPMVYA